MKVFEDAWHAADLPRGAVATIGNFDGVHRGQQAILNRVVTRGRELDAPPAVVTFAPHPAKVLWPERAPRSLTTPAQKVELLSAMGIDFLFVVRFDEDFAQTPPGAFVDGFLHDRLGLREVHVGSAFVFGRGRAGDLELLRESARGEDGPWAFGVEEVKAGGLPISSTRIREAVAIGHVDIATWLLGRPYQLLKRNVNAPLYTGDSG